MVWGFFGFFLYWLALIFTQHLKGEGAGRYVDTHGWKGTKKSQKILKTLKIVLGNYTFAVEIGFVPDLLVSADGVWVWYKG